MAVRREMEKLNNRRTNSRLNSMAVGERRKRAYLTGQGEELPNAGAQLQRPKKKLRSRGRVELLKKLTRTGALSAGANG